MVSRVRDEISEIKIIINRIQDGWEHAKQTCDEFYLDSVALNLHNFYIALERIFELIATIIDNAKPQGENWHLELSSNGHRN